MRVKPLGGKTSEIEMGTALTRLLGAEDPDNFNIIYGIRDAQDVDLTEAVQLAQQVRLC
jgi:succinate dehydrogenase flavin-adding protein (antitoxin of CptAB toxin-antitoxin module)